MSFFARLFFTQASHLIKLSQTEPIESRHQIEMPPEISAYSSNWNEELIDWSNSKSIYKTLFKASRPLVLKIILLQIVASSFAFMTPVFINQFITKLQLLNSGEMLWNQNNLTTMVLLSIGLGLCGGGHGLTIQHYFYRTLNFYQITTNIVNKKIYLHSLKISNATKQKNQIGEIVNLMGSDAESLGDSVQVTVDLSNSILLLVGSSIMLFYYIGWSALVAIIVMALLIPMTQRLVKKFTYLEDEQMKFRDQRMSIMAQILNAIRVVKYFSWEKSIFNEVSQVRNNEITSRVKLYKSEIFSGLIYTSISTVVLFTALLTHYLRGNEINLAIVLTCVAIFSTMEDQFGGLSRYISRFTSIFVGGARISNFLKSETIEGFKHEVVLETNTDLIFDHVNFSYGEGLRNVFTDLSFRLKHGEALAVIGPVGSGKSTLLQLILNEMELKSGKISIPHLAQIAYQSQEPFILNGTLKENIIFGNENKAVELNHAIFLASMASDIRLFPNGLQTEIGEKGVNLSGGQKQRVCLARCVLAHPDLILLDDPLSAVDIHTEASLCSQLIFGEWKNKTRIVTTHRISQLKNFDRILFLKENGYVTGTYDELFQSSTEFRNFIEIETRNQSSEKEIVLSKSIDVTDQVVSDNSRITVDEDRVIGSVDKAVYKSYVLALGGEGQHRVWIVFFVFLTAILGVLAPLAQKTWITKYSSTVDAPSLIFGYGALGLVTMVIYYLTNLFWMKRGIIAGRLFHDNALNAILKTEIRFFDSTPVGRILQRFSRDVESVDVHIQWTFEQTINSILQVSLAFLLIVITLPITLIFLMPILVYYYFLQSAYRRVAREVKRLDSLARSPRYAHFKETLQGLVVIRAFKKQDYFDQEFLQKLQKSTQAYYTHLMVNRWFSTRLPIIGSFISTITVLAIVYSSFHHLISAGVAGLITLYALQFWRYLNWGIRIFSDLESRMTSVERLSFYSDLLAEKEFTESQITPSTGNLEFKNVQLRYAKHLPYVLNNVSFDIKSGSKIGVVGRTGSGKSTLFQAVYRFVHFDRGDILLDGRSIRDYTIYNLRKSLAVIPQDPSLFMGTLRSNLDRYAEKSDVEINAILRKVGLYDFVQRLTGKLDHHINEGGANLSQGQRQLICLARALLMKVRVIFLDEATASVDVETDALVQKVIRESLDGITLVTIAHRLSTLQGYDKIIELDQGRVV
ncbi:MAG: ATP-binding cassette domain-containing protein [Moraxellaceae bacterium]|nr:ATP-binding cassette domain-containing protein [Pseudobdellovibrionaceae bacterium]